MELSLLQKTKKIGIINCNPSVEHCFTRSPWRQHPASLGKSNRNIGRNYAIRYAKERFQSLMDHTCNQHKQEHNRVLSAWEFSKSVSLILPLILKSEVDINSCFCSSVMPSASRTCSRCQEKNMPLVNLSSTLSLFQCY